MLDVMVSPSVCKIKKIQSIEKQQQQQETTAVQCRSHFSARALDSFERFWLALLNDL